MNLEQVLRLMRLEGSRSRWCCKHLLYISYADNLYMSKQKKIPFLSTKKNLYLKMADDATRYICLLRGKMQERIKSGPGEIFRAFREFRRAARSADNQISEIEFVQCLKHVGIIKKKGENGLARRIFRAIDTSKNGQIDFNEFMTNVIGSSVQDLTRLPSRENSENAKLKQHLKKQVAPNVHRDKVIEVLRAKLKQKTKGGAAVLLRSFKQFRTLSRSSDNLIDLSEFKTLLAHLGFRLAHEEAKHVFNVIDGDKNGSIDLEDFTRTLFDDCRASGTSSSSY